MKGIIKTSLIAFAFLLLVSINTFSQQPSATTVTAEGVAVISNNNTAMARDNAISDAQRKAVEQAVGTMVSAETVVQNYETLSDNVYSKTQGYIRSYNVISESPMGNLYQVTIQATVAAGDLKNDLSALGLLMAKKNYPRIMMMVAEQNIGSQYYTYWWNFGAGHADVIAGQTDMTVTENILMEKLSKKGFNVVDHSVRLKNVKISSGYKVETLSNDAIKTIGNLYDAEVVIYGKSLAKLAGSVMGTSMKSSQADVSLRAVNTDNGQVIASATNHGAAVHPNESTAGIEALKQATNGIADNLIDQIIARWSKDVSGGTMIQVTVSGVSSYGYLVKFKNALADKVRGVKSLHQRGFSSGVATLDVEFTGSAQGIADKLAMMQYEGFSVDITDITQNSIKIKMKTN